MLLVGAAGTLNVVFQLRVRNGISMAILTLNSIVWGVGVIVVAPCPGGIVAFAAAFLLNRIVHHRSHRLCWLCG